MKWVSTKLRNPPIGLDVLGLWEVSGDLIILRYTGTHFEPSCDCGPEQFPPTHWTLLTDIPFPDTKPVKGALRNKSKKQIQEDHKLCELNEEECPSKCQICIKKRDANKIHTFWA